MDPTQFLTDPAQLAQNPLLLGGATAMVMNAWKTRSPWMAKHPVLPAICALLVALLVGALAAVLFTKFDPSLLLSPGEHYRTWLAGGAFSNIMYFWGKSLGLFQGMTTVAGTGTMSGTTAGSTAPDPVNGPAPVSPVAPAGGGSVPTPSPPHEVG